MKIVYFIFGLLCSISLSSSLIYSGSSELCIYNLSNNVTCLNNGENITLNINQSYHFVLQPETKSFNMPVIIDILNNIFWIIGVLTAFIFIWYFSGWVNLDRKEPKNNRL